MKRILMCTLCALLAVSPLAAGWDEGVAAFKRGNYRAAVNEFRVVVEQSPEWHGGHHMLGRSYSALRMDKPALRHARRAYELHPTNTAYQLELAWAYFMLRQLEEMYKVGVKIDTGRLTPAQHARYDQMVDAYSSTYPLE